MAWGGRKINVGWLWFQVFLIHPPIGLAHAAFSNASQPGNTTTKPKYFR